MMLLVVLALLVVMSLIAVAFGYLVSAELRAANNALDRFRALSAARDGEAYAIAALRAYAELAHYEGEGAWSFNRVFEGGRIPKSPSGEFEDHAAYLKRYARNATLWNDSPEMVASFSKRNITNSSSTSDRNWVDLNGDGKIDPGEADLAPDLAEGEGGFSPLDRVSYFVGEGMSDFRIQPANTSGGTYRPLGDRARLKVIDTNAQLHVNDYEGEQLVLMLEVLGREIAAIVGEGDIHNPFPTDTAREIVLYKERNYGRIESKRDLRAFFKNQTIYDFAMDFIAVKSWPLNDSGVTGTQPNFSKDRAPQVTKNISPPPPGAASQGSKTPFTERELGDSGAAGKGADGKPEYLPEGSRITRAPVNINTVSRPVLAAMIAGLEAEARFFYFPRMDSAVSADHWVPGVRQMTLGTTDLGRQPLQAAAAGSGNETPLMPAAATGLGNLAVYQNVPIGPFGYGNLEAGWKRPGAPGSPATNPPMIGNHAANLAARIVAEREQNGPFRSWMDFDYRICHQMLAGFGATGRRSGDGCPDLVNTGRTDAREPLPKSFPAMPAGDGNGPAHLLPDPRNVRHPVSGKNAASSSYTAQEFDAWYWRACVDLIRANFNPDGYLNKFNPDAPFYTVVDSTDLKVSSAPMCFSSMGVYEIISQGEIAKERVSIGATQGRSGDIVVARRTVRSIVEVYRTFDHSTQADFVNPLDASSFAPSRTTQARGQRIPTVVTHDLHGTMTWPHSIDKSSFSYGTEYDDPKRSGLLVVSALTGSDDGGERRAGYFKFTAADSTFGWVSLYPQDRSPNPNVTDGAASAQLNFHAPYNYGLVALNQRTLGNAAPNGNVDSAGPYPAVLPFRPEMTDGISTASPDPGRGDDPALGTGFRAACEPSTPDAARYATLRPDGVLLRGWHINPLYRKGGSLSDVPTIGLRNAQRLSRLAILRYRAGHIGNNPFSAIAGEQIKDDKQVIPGADPASVVTRLFGNPPDGSAQGTDEHNILMQTTRQTKTNFPYYQGWVDFWIKWELPPQGGDERVICAGEIDPGSGNFSGLLGACSYGRFGPVSNYDSLNHETDFEGSEFFIFKEPGGLLRVSHLYFTRAWKTKLWKKAGQYSYTYSEAWERLGNNARVFGKATGSPQPGGQQDLAIDEYAGTNDICSRQADMGFSYSRMDSYANLNEAAGIDLVTHNWYRFSLMYRSNPRWGGQDRDPPHSLYIDGRAIPMTFEPPSLGGTGEAANTGETTDPSGQPKPFSSTATGDWTIHRSETPLIEVDPEDRLTIGCIFRRQHPGQLKLATSDAEITPLFRFDTNLVAPANATLDDVRISGAVNLAAGAAGSAQIYNESEYRTNSRYARHAAPSNEANYENAFVATGNGKSGSPLTFPVRAGCLSWTEYRPWWDSYERKRADLSPAIWANAPQVMFGVEVIGDLAQPSVGVGGRRTTPNFNSPDRNSRAFWLEGGTSLRQLYGAPVYIPSDFSDRGRPRVGMLKYTAYFVVPGGDLFSVLNASAVLDSVRLTVLTPPRRLANEEVFE